MTLFSFRSIATVLGKVNYFIYVLLGAAIGTYIAAHYEVYLILSFTWLILLLAMIIPVMCRDENDQSLNQQVKYVGYIVPLTSVAFALATMHTGDASGLTVFRNTVITMVYVQFMNYLMFRLAGPLGSLIMMLLPAKKDNKE